MKDSIKSIVTAHLEKTGTPVGVFIQRSGIPTPSFYRIMKANSCNLDNWRKLCRALGLPDNSPPPPPADRQNW